MNPEQPDHVQRALADLDARLGRITAEVAEVRAGLSALGRGAGGPGPGGSEGAVPPQAQPQGHPQAATRVPAPAPAHSGGPWRPPASAPAQAGGPWRPGGQDPRDPSRQEPPRRASRINAATIIAAIGGAIMLAGVAFLLVAAIQAGLFPPVARVVAAAVLALVLGGFGVRLQARHEARRDDPPMAAAQKPSEAAAQGVNPGALALVGTGFATAILDVIACATLYQWTPVPVAYTLVGGLALAGMILAQRWSSGLLACLVSAGTMLLSPLISTGVELPVFLVILAVATAALGAGLGNAVRVVWSVFPAPVLAGYLAQTGIHARGDQIALVVAALAFAAAGAGIAWYESMRRDPAPAYAALVVVPTAFPLALLPTVPFLEPGWPVVLVLSAAYLVAAYLTGRRADQPGPLVLSAVTGAAGSALLLTAWVELGGAERTGLALTLSATAYAIAAGLGGRRWLDWVAGIGAALAVVVYLGANQPLLALDEAGAVREFSYTDVVASLAVAALAVAAAWWVARRFRESAPASVIVGAVVALFAVSVMVVAGGAVIGGLAGQARDGFLVAHVVVTVLWICCAAWLVLTPRPPLTRARRLGFVLGALALAKLLLLDLATLPGLFRVLSFVVVGAVMLAVAVLYRRDTDPSGSRSPT